METTTVTHPFAPIYNSSSQILILGSIPSVRSRENNFFYGHPQNRFWKVLSALLNCETPETVEQKTQMLLDNHIAIWDTVAKCDISGSSDASIKNVVPTDISPIISGANIRAVFTNGATSQKYFNRFQAKALNIQAIVLPSTSPANASKNLEKLIEAWKVILEYLD